MPKVIGISVGFVTNSSSMVYHFPRKLLEDPTIQTFLKAFEVEEGFIGSDLWHRGECGTFAVTQSQKEQVVKLLGETEYCRPPAIDMDPDTVVVIYGDEYPGMASTISGMLRAAAERLGIRDFGGDEYN